MAWFNNTSGENGKGQGADTPRTLTTETAGSSIATEEVTELQTFNLALRNGLEGLSTAALNKGKAAEAVRIWGVLCDQPQDLLGLSQNLYKLFMMAPTIIEKGEIVEETARYIKGASADQPVEVPKEVLDMYEISAELMDSYRKEKQDRETLQLRAKADGQALYATAKEGHMQGDVKLGPVRIHFDETPTDLDSLLDELKKERVKRNIRPVPPLTNNPAGQEGLIPQNGSTNSPPNVSLNPDLVGVTS